MRSRHGGHGTHPCRQFFGNEQERGWGNDDDKSTSLNLIGTRSLVEREFFYRETQHRVFHLTVHLRPVNLQWQIIE